MQKVRSVLKEMRRGKLCLLFHQVKATAHTSSQAVPDIMNAHAGFELLHQSRRTRRISHQTISVWFQAERILRRRQIFRRRGRMKSNSRLKSRKNYSGTT